MDHVLNLAQTTPVHNPKHLRALPTSCTDNRLGHAHTCIVQSADWTSVDRAFWPFPARQTTPQACVGLLRLRSAPQRGFWPRQSGAFAPARICKSSTRTSTHYPAFHCWQTAGAATDLAGKQADASGRVVTPKCAQASARSKGGPLRSDRGHDAIDGSGCKVMRVTKAQPATCRGGYGWIAACKRTCDGERRGGAHRAHTGHTSAPARA